MSTRSSIYCQDVPEDAQPPGIHAFVEMIDGSVHITRESSGYTYEQEVVVSKAEAIELARAILRHFEAR
jgi:hypothetical protein